MSNGFNNIFSGAPIWKGPSNFDAVEAFLDEYIQKSKLERDGVITLNNQLAQFLKKETNTQLERAQFRKACQEMLLPERFGISDLMPQQNKNKERSHLLKSLNDHQIVQLRELLQNIFTSKTSESPDDEDDLESITSELNPDIPGYICLYSFQDFQHPNLSLLPPDNTDISNTNNLNNNDNKNSNNENGNELNKKLKTSGDDTGSKKKYLYHVAAARDPIAYSARVHGHHPDKHLLYISQQPIADYARNVRIFRNLLTNMDNGRINQLRNSLIGPPDAFSLRSKVWFEATYDDLVQEIDIFVADLNAGAVVQ